MTEATVRTATIAPKEEGKGRSFEAVCLATIEADYVSPLGSSDTGRPVFAMFAGSDTELRPFITNLRLGRKADLSDGVSRRSSSRVEFLKSADYQFTYQREPEGTIATICLPELFMIDPGMVDPAGIRFVMLPDQEWLTQEPEDVAEANEIRSRHREMAKHVGRFGYKTKDPDALVALAPAAYLFAAYLDRRSRCPLVADPRFYLQLLCACLERKLATFPCKSGWCDADAWVHEKTFSATGVEAVGFGRPIAFKASHTDFESLLSAETIQFFAHIEGKVKPKKMVLPDRPRF